VVNEPNRKEQLALFWYRLIAPLLDPGLAHGDRARLVRETLAKEWPIPGLGPRTISRATLFRKLAEYRRAGFGALKKRDRADKGSSRKIDPSWLKRAVDFRLEQPKRTTRRLIELAEKSLGLAPGKINLKTLSRILQQRKLTRRDLADETTTTVLSSFSHSHINQLWMSDVMDGFPIPDPSDPRRRKMTYLISFIDDASRLVPHAEFYFEENLPRLENTLKKAVQKRGIPTKLYVDNGQIFHATQFELIAAELDMGLIFTTPGRPEGHGKIERYHLTLQTDFLSEARAKGPRTLEDLNRWFWAWLEIAYHLKIHDSLGIPPLTFWMKQVDGIRFADPDVLDTVFLWREDRSVSKVRTFTLAGNLYEVAPELADQKIEVRFNPFDLSRILVFKDGVFQMRARTASLPQPRHPKVPAPPPRPQRPLSMSYLDSLVSQYEAHVKREFGRMDFAKIQEKRKLAVETDKGKFLQALGAHLDRALVPIEIAAARGLYDELAPLDPDVVLAIPKDPVPDAIAFGKFLSTLRALVLQRRQSKGGR
jgi:transposase InsO family protein